MLIFWLIGVVFTFLAIILGVAAILPIIAWIVDHWLWFAGAIFFIFAIPMYVEWKEGRLKF